MCWGPHCTKNWNAIADWAEQKLKFSIAKRNVEKKMSEDLEKQVSEATYTFRSLGWFPERMDSKLIETLINIISI